MAKHLLLTRMTPRVSEKSAKRRPVRGPIDGIRGQQLPVPHQDVGMQG